MFNLNEKIVYPGYGVARITQVVKKKIADQEVAFYELTFLSKEATILVPVANSDSAGLRSLSTSENIRSAFELLSTSLRRFNQFEANQTNWNKRNKDYQNKLKTGSLKDLLEIYRDLRYISGQKELSFGEKTLLTQTETLLVEEIAIVEEIDKNKAIEQLRAICSVHLQKFNEKPQVRI